MTLVHQRPRTDLTCLLEGYSLCSLSEGKNPNHIALVTTSVKLMSRFLAANGLPTDAMEIDVPDVRSFIRYLQTTPRFAHHPFTRAQDGGLSGHTINAYMRSIRAF